MTDYAIEAENACKQFKDNLALKHVDLSLIHISEPTRH